MPTETQLLFICFAMPVLTVVYFAGLIRLGAAAGLFAFMATAVALVLMWPLGALFVLAVCACNFSSGGRQEATR